MLLKVDFILKQHVFKGSRKQIFHIFGQLKKSLITIGIVEILLKRKQNEA